MYHLVVGFFHAYTLLFCAIGLFWYYGRSTFDHWKKLNVKFKKPVPFLGNLAPFLLLRKSFHEVFTDLYRYFGDEPFGGIFQMRDPALFVKDPELINNILIKDFKYFYDRGLDTIFFRNKKVNPLSENLFLAEGDRWKALRQKMSPVFSSGKLKQMYEQIFDCFTLMKTYIETKMVEDNSDVDLKELFERFTIDVIGTCAFGLDCNSLKSNSKFRTISADIFKPKLLNSMRIITGTFSKKLPILLKIPDFPTYTVDFFKNVVLDTVHYRRKNNVSRNDFLQLLMSLQNSRINPKFAISNQPTEILTNEEFDEIDIAANAFLFFIAGFETTASTLSFCLYELALQTDIQDKLRAEVERTRDKYGKIDPDTLKHMPFMDAVVAETLRKYPPLPILFRISREDYVIPNTSVEIKAGTKVLIPVYSIQHDWKYYPNPEVFDPERFNEDNKQMRSVGTFLPFGDGPRYCIGSRFAHMEIKTALAHFLISYNVTPCSKTQIPLTFKNGAMVLTAKYGTWVNISKRKV